MWTLGTSATKKVFLTKRRDLESSGYAEVSLSSKFKYVLTRLC